MFKVIDDFLTPTYHKCLLEMFESSELPWYHNSSSTFGFHEKPEDLEDDNDISNLIMFADGNGWRGHDHVDIIKPLVFQAADNFEVKDLLRVRATMTFLTPKGHEVTPLHTDYFDPNISMIYYVNESDGDTVVYDQDAFEAKGLFADTENLKEIGRCSPKANRLMAFDGNLFHHGMMPTEHKRRIIININFTV